MKSTRNQSGFTLVELLLAMAFFGSVLLLATLLLMQVMNIYNKGMVVKQMNQVGRTLMEDMARISNSGEKVTLLEVGTGENKKVSCITIDDVTYVWNRASSDQNDEDGLAETGASNIFINSEEKSINFAKLTSPTRNCSSIKPGVSGDLPVNELSPVLGGTVRVYDVVVQKIPTTNLVRVAMTLGTYDAPKSEYNLYANSANGGNLECRPAGMGNFCAKANFETVLYVPNGEFN